MSSTALTVPDPDPRDADRKVPVRLPLLIVEPADAPVESQPCSICDQIGEWDWCICCGEPMCEPCAELARSGWE